MGRILIGNVRHQLANNLTTSENGKYALDAKQGKELNEKKVNFADIINNFTTTVVGKVADARALKTLMDKYDELNRNIQCENFTLVNVSSNGSVTIQNQYCFKSGRHVHIEFSITGTIEFSQDQIMAMIPIKYTPATTLYCGLLSVLSNTGAVEILTVRSLRLQKYSDTYFGIYQSASSAPIARGKYIKTYIDYII